MRAWILANRPRFRRPQLTYYLLLHAIAGSRALTALMHSLRPDPPTFGFGHPSTTPPPTFSPTAPYEMHQVSYTERPL